MNAIQLDGAQKTRKKKKNNNTLSPSSSLWLFFSVNVRRVCVNDDDVVVDKLLKENLYKWK